MMELPLWAMIILEITGYIAVGSVYYGIGRALNDEIGLNDSLLYKICSTLAIDEFDSEYDIFPLNLFFVRIVFWPIFVALFLFITFVLIIADFCAPFGEWLVRSIAKRIGREKHRQY